MLQRKIQKEFFLVVLSIILVSTGILAFAVSSQYYERNPLYLQPGESIEMFFTLQNLASTEDVRLQATVTEGEDIIELTDSSEIYDVPSGEKTKVNFIVTAPVDAKKGDIFPISMGFATLTSGEGPIGLSGNIGKGFNLIVGEASDFDEKGNLKTNLSLAIFVITALATAIIGTAVFYLRKRKMLLKKISKSR